jgi:hypothetical protein
VLGAIAIVAVWRLVGDLSGRRAANRAAVLLCLFPASFVFSTPYSEGLAIAACGGALLMARRHRWVAAGVLGAVATTTRPNTVVIVVALLIAAWRCRGRAWTAPALAAAGAVLSTIAMWTASGRPLAWLDAERIGWHDHIDLTATTWEPVRRMVIDAHLSLQPVGLVDLNLALGVAFTLVAGYCLWRWRPGLPIVVFATCSIAMAACSHIVGPRPRLIIGAFPLVVAVAVEVRGRWFAVIASASAVLLVVLSWVTFTTQAVAP